MSANRKKLRDSVIKILQGTRAKQNVRFQNPDPNWRENLPQINVYFVSEQCEEISEAPRQLTRNLVMEVELIDKAKDNNDLNNKMDEFGEEVERALSVDDSLRSSASDIVLTNVDFENESDAKGPVASLRLTYRVEYQDYFPRDQAGQGVGDFTGFNDQWQVGHDQSAPTMAELDRAKEQINIPE